MTLEYEGRAFRFPAYADQEGVYPHFSCVEWLVPGQKVMAMVNSSSLASRDFADRLYIFDITDTSNITQDIVMLGTENKYNFSRMSVLAYEAETKILYIVGYNDGITSLASGKCYCEKFDMSGYLDNGTLTAPRIGEGKATEHVGLHLQDGGFYNGYIYALCDSPIPPSKPYNGLYIWVMDRDFNTVAIFDILQGNSNEGESFCVIPQEYGAKFMASVVVDYKNRYYEVTAATKSKLSLVCGENVTGFKIKKNSGSYAEFESNVEEYYNFGDTLTIKAIGSGDITWSDEETGEKVITIMSASYSFSASATGEVSEPEPDTTWNVIKGAGSRLYDMPQPFRIFTGMNSTYMNEKNNPKNKLYGIQIYETVDEDREHDVLIHDLLPSHNENEDGTIEYGLRDTITDKFYGNSNTEGFFEVGLNEDGIEPIVEIEEEPESFDDPGILE